VTGSTELVLPDAPEAADKEVVEMQEDYVAEGCAHDVVPAKCLNHPYYLMIQQPLARVYNRPPCRLRQPQWGDDGSFALVPMLPDPGA